MASPAKPSTVESLLQKMSAYRSTCPFLSQTPVQRLKELAATRPSSTTCPSPDASENKSQMNDSSDDRVNGLTAAAYQCPVMSKALGVVKATKEEKQSKGKYIISFNIERTPSRHWIPL
jgi:hypothetical protein